MVYCLDDITLGRFIEVYLGDIDKAVEGEHTKEEKQEAAERMCAEYMMIVGGKSVASMLVKRNSALKIEMRGTCLKVCEQLAKMGQVGDACEIMATMGYKVNPGDVLRKIESIRASDAYQLDRMKREEGDPVKPSREQFIKERVAVMAHLKMHIDEQVFKAKEYAYLVKQVSDEVEAMMKAYKIKN